MSLKWGGSACNYDIAFKMLVNCSPLWECQILQKTPRNIKVWNGVLWVIMYVSSLVTHKHTHTHNFESMLNACAKILWTFLCIFLTRTLDYFKFLLVICIYIGLVKAFCSLCGCMGLALPFREHQKGWLHLRFCVKYILYVSSYTSYLHC
jgi:hypothetical protein